MTDMTITQEEIEALRAKLAKAQKSSWRSDHADFIVAVMPVMSQILDLASTAIAAREGAAEAVALWMIQNSIPTGHGDTLDDLLRELRASAREGANDWQLNPVPDHVTEFLQDVTAAVEATSYEQYSLWKEFTEHGRTWEQINPGIGWTIGKFGTRPVFLSLSKIRVDGQMILVYEAASQLVDHIKVEEWIDANLPPSAQNEQGRIRRTDAPNACNILIPAQEGRDDD
jgi:hypothetical protein